ncbi:MAG TPA: site-specific integrase [Flavisolibacter sp.]|jgi:site-specific recombinase XerD|nr:site-specific integrase [Flavisolibacter sp.]
MYHILFFIKRNKKRNGKFPVYCRITIQQLRSEFSINTWVTETQWNLSEKKFPAIDMRLKVLYESLITKSDVTAQMLRDAYKGQKTRYLLKLYKAHLKEIKLLKSDYTTSTYNCYKRALELLQQFVKTKYRSEDIPMNKVDFDFVKSFDFFLKATLQLAKNTVVKYMARLKKVVRIALAHHWIENDPFSKYKMRFELGEKEWLDGTELKRLTKRKFSIERLDRIKNVFLFCCYTGLSYSDVAKLTKDHLRIIGNEKWIIVNRTKTDITSRIPLLSYAEKILNKYANNGDKLLPVPSNQKMNAYLKEIADLCGLKKTLTVHVARHTFATTVTLTNGVSIESVSKMLGHSSVKMTAHYSRVVDEKLSNEMNELRKKLHTK